MGKRNALNYILAYSTANVKPFGILKKRQHPLHNLTGYATKECHA